MAINNDELLQRLLATFRGEAEEHLNAMAAGLLGLEKSSTGPEAMHLIEAIFREAHSLKGAARAVNLSAVESLCQSLESVFSALKKNQLAVNFPLLDLLHQALDSLNALLNSSPSGSTTPPPHASELLRHLDAVARGAPPAGLAVVQPPREMPEIAVPPTPPALSTQGSGTVRIATGKLDAVMRQTEELLTPRLAARQRTQELYEVATLISGWKKLRTRLQPAVRRLEHGRAPANQPHDSPEWSSLFAYLDDEQQLLQALDLRLRKLGKVAARDQRSLESMSESLLQGVKEMQLLPCAYLLAPLPRQARELAREQGKEIEVVVQDNEIELDRRILEEMKDPLIHLLRNAIDHGIESPAARIAAGKPAAGKITVTVTQQDGGKIAITFADDGAGIDIGRVITAAKKQGNLAADMEAQPDQREVMALIFQSGISTSQIITDVSGRGLGLAIVREKIERLGGSIEIESQPGSGTAFHITLPLALATMRGVLVRAGTQLCALPLAGIERVARVAIGNLRTVENRLTIELDGEVLAFSELNTVLEIPRTAQQDKPRHATVVVLTHNQLHIAFGVDELAGEQEILVKSLGPQLARVRNVAGATLLGTGQVVPVLNLADLIQSAIGQSASAPALVAPQSEQAAERLSILVAEDSITSRSLLRSILEAAGYRVVTAVDGLDAYTTLKTDTFNLVVSDVEMPRMDGFDLTAKIRADKQLAELPVILVTALGSREHRERGIDAGANAYIVKSSFDQSNLLETIRRLI